jgi:hypothetical protein
MRFEYEFNDISVKLIYEQFSEFEKSQPFFSNNHDSYNAAFDQNSQAHFCSTMAPPQFQQQYACQKCNFFSSDSQVILAHLHSPFYLNGRPTSFQRAEQPFYAPAPSNPHLISSKLKILIHYLVASKVKLK